MTIPKQADEWVTRVLPVRAANVHVADDRHLAGTPIVFNTLSLDLGGFKERIAPSAVDRTIRNGSNVDALLDHRRETTTILGSTDSGLMRQRKERHGLTVTITPPDTAAVRDLITVIKAGLVKGMSFRFRVMPEGSTWDEEDGILVRTVTDMEYNEVSIVLNPAYLETDVSARTRETDAHALEEFKASQQAWRPSLRFRERQFRASTR